MGDRMEKYWDECSEKEHKEVEQIEKKIADLYEQFGSGTINHQKFSYRRTMLRKKVEEVWNKYAEEM